MDWCRHAARYDWANLATGMLALYRDLGYR